MFLCNTKQLMCRNKFEKEDKLLNTMNTIRMRLLGAVVLIRKKQQCYYQNWRNKRNVGTITQKRNTSRGESGGVWVEANPRVCLHDVHAELRAGGLSPNSPVTLTANLIDENGKRFCSNAHYNSDASGQVDVGSQASVGGSYTGVFPAGLLSTLAPAPDEFQFLRLYKKDPLTPWKITMSVGDGHTELQRQPKTLADVGLERHFMAPGVQRIPIREGRVRATMFLPSGRGPFPGVIDMFGAIGGLLEFRSAMLASRGIASLALAYFAYEDLPKNTDKFEIDYFEEAINVLLSQPGVVKDRCGVIAVSKSTDIAFALATWLSQVKAVVSISGSPIAFDSVISYQGKTLQEGVKLGIENLIIDEEGRLYPNRNVFKEHFSPRHPQFIPINEADDGTHFLVVAGDDDAWATDICIEGVQQRMQIYGKTNYETVLYPGAGHMIEPPYGPLIYHSYHRHLPVVDEDGLEKISGVRLLWGGNAISTCKAQEDLWIRMRKFLITHVRDESPWYQNQVQMARKL